jgi:hypothetical protein
MEPDEKEKKHKDAVKSIRSLVFFILGLGVFINEAFIVDDIKIELIAASLALMGLPAVLKADEVRRNGAG